MSIEMKGTIMKMKSELSDVVNYALPLSGELLPLNEHLEKKVKLEFFGDIFDIHDGKKIKKSYGQGYSYPNFIKLPQCDTCIVKPELCHFHKGTCRDPEWGKKNCFIPHYVYLAVSSDVKVGITRHTQVPTRWIDQGASYALPILEVSDRKTSGEIEKEIAKNMKDKTNWRKMLSGEVPELDLESIREDVFDELADLLDDFGAEDLEEEVTYINYPVVQYPTKIKSVGFDKQPLIEGTLMGIKGQYLIFDNCVVNMRKHQGYEIQVTID